MKLNEITERKASDLEIVQNYKSGDLNISLKNLVSLKGCPKEINGNFNCSNNLLTSLEGGSEKINGYYICRDNQLMSLKGCPERITEWFSCANNQLSSFEYFPKYIHNECGISNNKFTSFKDIDKHINSISGDGILHAIMNDITSGYLDLFGIDGLQKIKINNKEIKDIVNKYLPEKDLINFQDEMIKAGFESYL